MTVSPPALPEQPLPPVTPPKAALAASATTTAKHGGRASLTKLSLIVMLAISLVLALPLAIGAMLAPGPLAGEQTLVIPRGMPTRDIAAMLDQHDVIYHPLLFRAAAKIFAAGALKAGEYRFTPQQSAADIALMMHEGRMIVHKFTVAEGLTSADIARLLDASPSLQGETPATAEGSLLPETYSYSYGDTRAEIIARMKKSMQDLLAEEWPKRDPALPLKSPAEAVIMASVIEKETGKAVERPRIAGVFYNRLRFNMRLQSDPTVIYAITLAKGPMGHTLLHEDLAFPSPINTYASDGLPSQPICNPGRAAIEAALHPENNNFLYFVADGTGGHVFAKDLAQHNENVARYRDRNEKP